MTVGRGGVCAGGVRGALLEDRDSTFPRVEEPQL